MNLLSLMKFGELPNETIIVSPIALEIPNTIEATTPEAVVILL